MKMSAAEVRKWVQVYSDDLMHFSEEELEYVVSVGKLLDVETLPDEAGIIGYVIVKDFDCKKNDNSFS